MLFTSLHWLVFLGVVFVGHHLAPPRSTKWLMLLASIYFYSSWSVPYLSLIFGQLCVDWLCGHFLGKTDATAKRKQIVAVSVAINLGALCVFKYYGFIARTIASMGLALPPVDLELPLGISFYTFESMSYTIDVYRRRLKPVSSPLHLALFITWFPHLVAGPIVRPSGLLPQFDQLQKLSRACFFSGLSLILIGYAKKLFIADWLARVVEPAFVAPGNFTSLELLLAVYAYAYQIYCDFSAYTDIARGASRWFGIELPENFNDPYLATSITDFWRRWHMTLSHWLRDYLYIPLGGNKLGRGRTYANLFITMLLGGLWHGAAWTFVAWGGLHGTYLAIERLLGVDPSTPPTGAQAWLRRVLTFHLVCLSWIFFRAPTFETAWTVLHGISGGTVWLTSDRLLPMLGAITLIATYWVSFPLRARLLSMDPGPSLRRQAMWIVAASLLLVIMMALGSSASTFIYFQF
jgi:D-alanyl-lipoteichoic acid acyltransferase DltB (MBOAT superfamily)